MYIPYKKSTKMKIYNSKKTLRISFRQDTSLFDFPSDYCTPISVYTYKGECPGWKWCAFIERGWQPGDVEWKLKASAILLYFWNSNLHILMCVVGVRRCHQLTDSPTRHSQWLPFAALPLGNFRNFIECALGEFPWQMAPPSRQHILFHENVMKIPG